MLVETNAFQAIGRSWPGFWIIILRVMVISVPLSYFFTKVLGFSIWGVWIAVIAGNIISSIAGYLWITKAMKNIIPEAALHDPVKTEVTFSPFFSEE
jgi:Na+-driven multidrug efflux pump